MLILLFWLSLLGKEHKMLLLFTVGKEEFKEKLGKGRKCTFSWLNFQMTQSIWKVHIFYISASSENKKNSHAFLIKAKLTSITIHPIFLTYYSASGEHIPQTNAAWAVTKQSETGWSLPPGTTFHLKQPETSPSDLRESMWIACGSC